MSESPAPRPSRPLPPVAIVIGVLFIYAIGYTMNTSTLLAIGLSVGVLVSNSIVVLESIESRLAEGKSVREATRIGASEVAVAVLASAGTNMVVFLPIAMMGSMVGLFFRPFAVTSLIVNIVSLFISFTLTPPAVTMASAIGRVAEMVMTKCFNVCSSL